MKLVEARVRDFRCVEDSMPFAITDITALVGKNESGKTALLVALEKLNPVVATRGNFIARDYPRRKWRPDEELPPEPPPIWTKWKLDDDELQAIEAKFGAGCLHSGTVEFSKSYADQLVCSFDANEGAIIEHALSKAGISDVERQALGDSLSNIAALRAAAAELEPKSPAVVALNKTLEETLKEGIESIETHVKALLPKFLYFGEYQKLDGQVAINEYTKRKAANGQTWSDLLFEALLNLAGTTPEKVTTLNTFEELNASLRAVSNQISREIFEYWSQNKHLKVTLALGQAMTGDPAPFNSGLVFRTRIDNTRHGADTSFAERSSGFVWFFSFIIWFSQLRKRYGNRIFILLDEPGLTLHARAQADLLRYMNEKLRPQHQVIYTTHSPFMIDPDNILAARTVEDAVEGENILGTKVGDEVLSTDPDTISPLQRCLDYELSQTLFVGRNTLLVEGPSDLAYLKWFSRELELANRIALDYRWTICIVGGIDRIPGFVSLFRGNHLRVAALVDVMAGTKQRLENVEKALGVAHVFRNDKLCAKPEADIEDVIGEDFYLPLVNRAYNLRAGEILTKSNLSAATRLAVAVETHFKTLPVHVPEFDDYGPAEYLFAGDITDANKLPGYASALDRFETLFKGLNALLPATEGG